MKGSDLSRDSVRNEGKGGSSAKGIVEQPRTVAPVPDPKLPTEQESQEWRVKTDPQQEDCIIVSVEHANSFAGNPNTDRFLSQFHPLESRPRVTLDPDACANVVKVWYGSVGKGVCIGYLNVPTAVSCAWVTTMLTHDDFHADADHDFRTVAISGDGLVLLWMDSAVCSHDEPPRCSPRAGTRYLAGAVIHG